MLRFDLNVKKQTAINVVNEVTARDLTINDATGNVYPNRKIKTMSGIVGESLLCDGYATWAKGELNFPDNYQGLTLSTWVVPLSFEDESGVLSYTSDDGLVGFSLSIKKYGVVQFEFKYQEAIWSVYSKTVTLAPQQWSHVQVVFDGLNGWMYLYVNGVEVGRQQFVRNTTINANQGICLVGNKFEEIKYAHTFNGYINTLKVYDQALTREALVQSYYGDLKSHNGHIPFVSPEIVLSERVDFNEDFHRPQYHLSPNGKWMNEPHGPIFFEGYYHIFYQANPHAARWNNLQWGHWISQDMVHWEEVRLAVQTNINDIDKDGIWSGSCCLDERGIPAIFYTAGDDSQYPNQMVAVAKSDYLETGDVLLQNYKKEPKPLVVQTQGAGFLGEFRDPFVWRENNRWYMLVGTGDVQPEKGGNAVLYSSIDMKTWEYHGYIMEYDYSLCEEVGHVWELPVLLPLRNQSGDVVKHILTLCACQIDHHPVETYYWLGHWDSSTFKFTPEHDKPLLFDLGCSNFTGGTGFETPNLRSVFFTIAQGRRPFDEEFCSGWAHNAGLPIELFCHEDGTLGIKEINELQVLRKATVLEMEQVTVQEVNEALKQIKDNKLECRVTFANATLSAGIGVLYDTDGCLNINYNSQTNKLSVYDKGNEVGVYRGMHDDIILNEELQLTAYLDYSQFEVFVNERKMVTRRTYPKTDSRQLTLFGSETAIVASIQVYSLNASLK